MKDFKKLLKNKDFEGKQKLYQGFRSDLLEVLKDPYEQAVNEYFDFISWLDSKIDSKLYKDVVKEKVT